MPRIAQLKQIDGEVWARVDMEMGSPIELLSPQEIEANRNRELRQLDEIERLRAALKNFADPSNWSDEVGCLQWMGKRHAIEFAQSVVNDQQTAEPPNGDKP